MKSILVLAAAFALSATAASAECVGHSKIAASADQADKEITTASVTKAEQSTPSDDLLLQQKLRQERSDTEE
jgi:hypothetical protein